MLQYITLRGIFKRGKILLSKENIKKIKELSKVVVLVPADIKKGIAISDFLLKGNYCSVGGDALKDSENLYNA